MRELEHKCNVSWRTVKKAVNSVWPEPRKKLPPRPTALDPYKPVIDEMLRTDLDAPLKQCHTITRIFHRFIQEHSVEVSSPMVRRYVPGRNPEILAASGKARWTRSCRLRATIVDPSHLQRHHHRNRHRLLPPGHHSCAGRTNGRRRLTSTVSSAARRPLGRRARSVIEGSCPGTRLAESFGSRSRPCPPAGEPHGPAAMSGTHSPSDARSSHRRLPATPCRPDWDAPPIH